MACGAWWPGASSRRAPGDFSKDVAIKLLRDESPPKDELQRLRGESRILAPASGRCGGGSGSALVWLVPLAGGFVRRRRRRTTSP